MIAADFVRDYGYFAVMVGTFFEGELIILAAGVAASAGVLHLPLVIAAGMTGIFASDTVCFLLGRWAGERLKRWFPRLYARLGSVFQLIERHDEKLIVYFQFFPGLCTVTPVAFGMSRISTFRFMAFDLVGNAFWTGVFAVGGYFFGNAFEKMVQDARGWTPLLAGVVLVAAVSGWWITRRLGRQLTGAGQG